MAEEIPDQLSEAKNRENQGRVPSALQRADARNAPETFARRRSGLALKHTVLHPARVGFSSRSFSSPSPGSAIELAVELRSPRPSAGWRPSTSTRRYPAWAKNPSRLEPTDLTASPPRAAGSGRGEVDRKRVGRFAWLLRAFSPSSQENSGLATNSLSGRDAWLFYRRRRFITGPPFLDPSQMAPRA